MTKTQETLHRIPQEIDAEGWNLYRDETDLKIFTKFGACDAPVIGFKTITEHSISATKLYNTLKDVNKAMELINDQFLHGEVLEEWPIAEDQNGSIVRTSFDMPFPFTNREFLHGLHSIQHDDNTYIVGYTPVEKTGIPVQKGFIRSPMYVSGQRISQLENGSARVEHLMVYELGGGVSKFVQDNIMKAGHAGAYKKEWRTLREMLFPPALEEIDYNDLSKLLHDALQISKDWKIVKKAKQGEVRSGRLAYCPKTIYRTDTILNTSINKVVEVLADKSLEYLPKWNKEFMNGKILKEMENTPAKSSWLVHVQYSTPGPIAHREYIYYFSREWISEDEAIIIYNSVESTQTIPDGFVRALLYPTVHSCVRTNEGTKVEHLLATDLKGKLGRYQDSLLKGGLAQAHVRDLDSQLELFKNY